MLKRKLIYFLERHKKRIEEACNASYNGFIYGGMGRTVLTKVCEKIELTINTIQMILIGNWIVRYQKKLEYVYGVLFT